MNNSIRIGQTTISMGLEAASELYTNTGEDSLFCLHQRDGERQLQGMRTALNPSCPGTCYILRFVGCSGSVMVEDTFLLKYTSCNSLISYTKKSRMFCLYSCHTLINWQLVQHNAIFWRTLDLTKWRFKNRNTRTKDGTHVKKFSPSLIFVPILFCIRV